MKGYIVGETVGVAVKTILNLILAALLLACPQMCRGATTACCAEDRVESDGLQTPELPRDEAVGCICAGAVRAVESSTVSQNADDDRPTDLGSFAAFLILPSALFVAPPRRIAAPPGATGDGSIRLHLRLQNLRR